MKNFRKSIIALATVAAMLVPSVAMAATITATVEDKAVAGNVYAGFYKGDVLVKAELGGTTKVETTTTSSGSTEEAELTQPAVSAKIVTGENDVKKLVFTATPDADMGVIAAAAAIFSYDSTVVVPESNAFKFFTDKYASNTLSTNASVATYADGNRVIVKAEGAVAGGAEFALPADGVNVIEFSFTVAEGKEITADTFKIEDDYDANPVLAQVYGDRTSSTATGLFLGTSSDYVRYGAWDNGADTLTWNGFKIVEDVQPTDKPVVTVADEFVGTTDAGSVHKLVFSVKAPAGTEVFDAKFDFVVDTEDVTFWNVANKALITGSLKKAAIKNACVFPTVEQCSDCGYTGSWYNATGSSIATEGTLAKMTVALTNTGCSDGCEDTATAYAIDSKAMFAEFYYVVNEGKKVDENTFAFANATFDEEEATFAGFPWKAAEVTTTTKTLITVDDVTAPADYDSIKVFVWDANQVAQCAPVAGTLN